MKRWQFLSLAALFIVPVVFYVGVAFWALWKTDQWYWVGWLLPVCWCLAWGLYYAWTHGRKPSPVRTIEPPGYWSPQDRAAVEKIARCQQQVVNATSEQLIDPHYYLETARQLALDLARHYNPDEKVPLDSVTVTELLAAAELALHDSSEWIREHVPGSHLLLLRHWRWLGKAPKYARIAGNATWVAAMVFNPLNIARYLMSRLAWDSASDQLQTSALRAFAEMFVERAGFYLVELHSGRLKLGADRYRAAREQLAASRALGLTPSADGNSAPTTGDQARAEAASAAEKYAGVSPTEAIVAVVGQVKAGKSSLINCLLGERRAAVDVLPKTQGVQPYRLALESGAALTLLDTQGYGGERSGRQEAKQVGEALERADLIILVLEATSPARQADAEFLEELRQRFADRPHRRPPPIIGVLTHIDALRPPQEWNPPYAWENPTTPKERNIRDAVDYNANLLRRELLALVPACTDLPRERVFGVDEFVLPAIVAHLDEARACSLLRVLHEDWEQQRVYMVFNQLKRAGIVVAKYLAGLGLNDRP